MIMMMMAYQLVDSNIMSTRKYWRKEIWKFSDDIVNDPRTMKEIFGDWPDWRLRNTLP